MTDNSREKIIRLREELMSVEAERAQGVKDWTPDELESYLDAVIAEA